MAHSGCNLHSRIEWNRTSNARLEREGVPGCHTTVKYYAIQLALALLDQYEGSLKRKIFTTSATWNFLSELQRRAADIVRESVDLRAFAHAETSTDLVSTRLNSNSCRLLFKAVVFKTMASSKTSPTSVCGVLYCVARENVPRLRLFRPPP